MVETLVYVEATCQLSVRGATIGKNKLEMLLGSARSESDKNQGQRKGSLHH